jgi:hypothetical protein
VTGRAIKIRVPGGGEGSRAAQRCAESRENRNFRDQEKATFHYALTNPGDYFG